MAKTEDFPRVAVVGAGAVGCYFGAMLARAGVPVRLIGRTSHVEAIRNEGLHLDGLRVNERISMAATTSMEEGLGDASVILFCVKSGSTESAALEMRPFLIPGSTILSFQNGVDNPDRIHYAIRIYPIPTAVYVAAEMTAHNRVTHTGRGDLVIGHHSGWPQVPQLAPLAALFEQAGIPCKVSERIEADLWAKMVMNCAYNALSALTRSQYGRMVRSEPVRAFGVQVIQETVAVARAEGVLLDEKAMIEAAFLLAEKMTLATSSMAQDLARNRPTEIDSLNGYVVRRGEALGVATPASELLVAMLKLLEYSILQRASS
ncbi:MAG: 2-dehydropantoate 2-reductase [Paludibaculum sp.]